MDSIKNRLELVRVSKPKSEAKALKDIAKVYEEFVDKLGAEIEKHSFPQDADIGQTISAIDDILSSKRKFENAFALAAISTKKGKK